MKALIYLHLLLLLLLSGTGSAVYPDRFMVEICENAIDDDLDGLIDLNDPDCDCPIAAPQSLIPNPSFEEKACCPSSRSQLHCAEGWIQASEATTDYLHTCGWMGWPDLPPPLPIPDGQGFVGWRNGRAGGGGNANWKEYSGACLKGPLKAGVTYRFDFWVGFTNAINSPPTSIVFYGSKSCENLPFGRGNQFFGCPTNGPGWVEFGSVPINGANEWKQYQIIVTPTSDFYAIAIGPDCIEVPPVVSFYYFFDNLVLAALTDFAFDVKAKGHPCSGQMTLEVADVDTLHYQWYRDGIALPGQTRAILSGAKVEGNYQVRMRSALGCAVSKPYWVKIPLYHSSRQETICNTASLRFNGYALEETGVYYDTLKNANLCDSIVRLDLRVLPEIIDTVHALIFEGESYQIGLKKFQNPGTYYTVLNNWLGCDSTVVLHLNYFTFYFPTAFSPNGDGLNDFFTIYAPSGVKEISGLQIFDRWGGMKYSGEKLSPEDPFSGWDGASNGKMALPGIYVYKANVLLKDGRIKTVSGAVTLMK